MNTIQFKNGDKIITKLATREYIRRYNILDTLRVLVEGHEEGTGVDIYNKTIKALNKNVGFTGIIRLNNTEKDFLSYKLESTMISDNDRKVILKYTQYKE